VYRGERRIPASGEGRDYVSAYKEPIYEDGKESRAVCDNCQFESSWSQHAEDIARAARYHEAWAATYDGYCPEYGMPRASKGTP
jgi:hypothetical protein